MVSLFSTSSSLVLWASDWTQRPRQPRGNAIMRSGRVRTRRLLLRNVISNIGCAHLTALITTWALHIATILQVLIGALTTALGAALSGKNVRSLPRFVHRDQSLTITEPVISRDLHPRRRVDSRSIIHSTLAEYERARGIAYEGCCSQTFLAGGRCVPAGPWV